MLSVWGELASHKDALTHRLGSQGGAPGVLLSCHVMCINFVYVFCMDIFGFVNNGGGGFYLFLYLIIHNGWYAMNYNFMPFVVSS